MTDDDVIGPTSGIEIRVQLVDYADRDEDGDPQGYQATQRMTDAELAREDTRDLVEHVVELAADNILRSWRGDGDD